MATKAAASKTSTRRRSSSAAAKKGAKPAPRKKPAARVAAADTAAATSTESVCSEIRAAVDQVLADASGDRIDPSTPGDRLLSLFIVPDKIQFLHIRLNQALSGQPSFTPFSSSEIKTTSSIGDVRKAGAQHCGVDCPG